MPSGRAADRRRWKGRDYRCQLPLPGQVVIDVGINVDAAGHLVGDVDFAAAEAVVGAVTPVPGGVGAVTTSVLARHVLDAAAKSADISL